MKNKLLILLILSLSAINLSFAGEKNKNSYFSDGNRNYKQLKKIQKKDFKRQRSQLETRKKKGKQHLRVKPMTDKH